MAETVQTRTLDLIVRSEITIDRSVKDVWPHFLNMSAWMEDIRFQGMKGPLAEEGQGCLGTSKESGDAFGGFIVKVVRVSPYVQYVLKVKPENGTDYTGFADFSFVETGGKTRLIYDFYMELTVSRMGDLEFQNLSDEQYRKSRQGMARNNQNLKALAESMP